MDSNIIYNMYKSIQQTPSTSRQHSQNIWKFSTTMPNIVGMVSQYLMFGIKQQNNIAVLYSIYGNIFTKSSLSVCIFWHAFDQLCNVKILCVGISF